MRGGERGLVALRAEAGKCLDGGEGYQKPVMKMRAMIAFSFILRKMIRGSRKPQET